MKLKVGKVLWSLEGSLPLVHSARQKGSAQSSAKPAGNKEVLIRIPIAERVGCVAVDSAEILVHFFCGKILQSEKVLWLQENFEITEFVQSVMVLWSSQGCLELSYTRQKKKKKELCACCWRSKLSQNVANDEEEER